MGAAWLEVDLGSTQPICQVVTVRATQYGYSIHEFQVYGS
jgi:hypothetical protein